MAASDAASLNDNATFAQVFGRVIDTAEDERVKLAEAVWADGIRARESAEVEEAAKLFEAVIHARSKGLCSDVKAGRDRAIEMRQELLALHGEGGGAGRFDDEDRKVKIANVQEDLGFDLENRGEFDEALALYQEAVQVLTDVHGQESEEVARILLGIGRVYASQGKFEEALESYVTAEKVYVALFGYEHLHVASTYNNMANVYYKQGQYK